MLRLSKMVQTAWSVLYLSCFVSFESHVPLLTWLEYLEVYTYGLHHFPSVQQNEVQARSLKGRTGSLFARCSTMDVAAILTVMHGGWVIVPPDWRYHSVRSA